MESVKVEFFFRNRNTCKNGKKIINFGETNLISAFIKKISREIELYLIQKSPQTSIRMFQKHPMFKLLYLRKKVKANQSK